MAQGIAGGPGRAPQVIAELVGLAAGTVLLWRVPTVGSSPAKASMSISVIVPARDEAHRLPGLLESLPTDVEVIVVDDGSRDGTGDVARAHGARVLRADGPPTGWLGKPWACSLGVEAATGDLLVLLDADVRVAPGGLDRLAAEHRRTTDGLLSVQPFHVTHRLYEQLSAVGNVVSVMAAGLGVAGVARVAFGPCLVTTPAALAAAGGFAAVRHEVVEDAALAVAYRRAGRPVRLLAGGDAVRFRMYEDGVRSLWEGWVKSLAGGARRAALVPTSGAVAWVTGALAATVGMLRPTASSLGLYAAFAIQLAWMLRRIGSFRWWLPMVFPAPLLAFVVLFAVSLARRRVTWRGRTVPV